MLRCSLLYSLINATIWIPAAAYIVFLYPIPSIRPSDPMQPKILPIQGREFIRAFLVGGKVNSPPSLIPNRRRKDGRACKEPKEPVSLKSGTCKF